MVPRCAVGTSINQQQRDFVSIGPRRAMQRGCAVAWISKVYRGASIQQRSSCVGAASFCRLLNVSEECRTTFHLVYVAFHM
jgi:hypothetical protein